MTNEDFKSQPYLQEIDYYKRQLEELGGENFKLDQTVTGLRRELNQKRQGFALLSELQQSIGAQKQISQVFEIIIKTINSVLGMDKTVILMPTHDENTYRPSQWLGYHDQPTDAFTSLTIEFPPEFSSGAGLLLINKTTPATPLIEQLRANFGLPYFICIPVMGEDVLIGLILSGRLIEAYPVAPPLNQGDIETFRAIAGLLSSYVRNLRVAVLEETDRLKTEFFANISHEFRTPITLTLGHLEGILTGRYGNVSSLTREKARVVQRHQEYLLGLVNQILDMAKLEAGHLKLKARRMQDMNHFVEERANQFRTLAEKHGLELRLELDPLVHGADLYIDRENFEKLLSNLLSNAIKFTKQGSVEVGTAIRDSNFQLSVTDTGIGIQADHLPTLFDRFHQVDGSASREYAGTGLGLTWVKQIAELHGGSVTVHSQFGAGTTFRVNIPLGKDHLDPTSVCDSDEDLLSFAGSRDLMILPEDASDIEDTERLNRETELGFDASKSTIVYAEDNPDMRVYLRDILKVSYNLFLAVDGRDGLVKVKKYRPDLLLTDHMMPFLSGRDLLREVRQDNELRTIPVVFLTARAGTEARVESLDAGADDYLSKPFDESELLARIRNLLQTRAQEHRLAELNTRLEAKIQEQMAALIRSGDLVRFLPRSVAESLLAGKLEMEEKGERRKITTLFSDIVGFTTLTERLEPEDLFLLLKEYLYEMTSVVVANGGVVIQFIGDALMVVFGAPQMCPDVDQAWGAVRTALDMLVRAQELSVRWRRRGIPHSLELRIGINTGYCTVGIVGSEYLQSYSACGTPINIASRLQTGAAPGEILCGFPTYALIQERVNASPRGQIIVKNITQPVEVYAIHGLV